MSTAMAAPRATSALKTLQKQCMLVSVHQSRWPGQYTLPRGLVKTTIGGQDVDEAMVTNGQALFIPDDWKKRLNEAYSGISRVLRRYTLPFRFGTARAMPNTARTTPEGQETTTAELFFADLEQVRTNLAAVVAEFVPVFYQQILPEKDAYFTARMGADAYARHLRQRLPTEAELPGRFGVEVGIFELSEASLAHIQREELREHLQHARQNTRTQIETALADLVKAPRERLVKALSRLQEQLENGQRLTAGSFTAAREAIELLRNFAHMTGDDLLEAVNTLQQRIEGVVTQGEHRAKSTTF